MTNEEFTRSFPVQLNNQQMEAVRSVEGPVLLLAVPGSGKTTVLVTRLGYMLYCCGIAPENILMLTYTRAAAADMSDRFTALFGNEFQGRLEFRTINSICDRIIRYYGQLIGKAPFRLESDEKHLGQIIASVYRNHESEYPTDNDIKNVRTFITYIKNMKLNEEEISQLGTENDLKLSEIYREYQHTMRSAGIMDYDDQMVYALNILKRSPQTLDALRRRYRYICVDEAQDTSKIQHEIIALLAADNENLFMVGDEDQSIYGFRAAYPQALLDFEKMHAGARVLLMERNYRSNGNIVSAADQFIGHNLARYNKHMTAERPDASRIRRLEVKSRRAQYRYLLKVVQNIYAQDMPQQQMRTAVLYRNNDSALPLVDMLEREGLPYRMQSRDLMFFTHRVVTDIRNIILFANDQSNTDLFMQIYYKIGLYVNRKDAEHACRICLSGKNTGREVSVLDALEKGCSLQGYRLARIRAVRTNLNILLEESSIKALGRILKGLEYNDYLERSGLSDDKIRILLMLASDSMKPLEFLDRLDWLKEKISSAQEDKSCNFILSTIHSSKGLEYENVYLIDCADGIFPQNIPSESSLPFGKDNIYGTGNQDHIGKSPEKNAGKNGLNNQELLDFEEERRMFYVAVTRAKDNLTVFSLPQGCIFTDELFGEDNSLSRKSAGKSGVKNSSGNGKSGKFSEQEFKAFSDKLGAGISVYHSKFGAGVISATDAHSVTICFENSDERQFNTRILFEKGLLEIE